MMTEPTASTEPTDIHQGDVPQGPVRLVLGTTVASIFADALRDVLPRITVPEQRDVFQDILLLLQKQGF